MGYYLSVSWHFLYKQQYTRSSKQQNTPAYTNLEVNLWFLMDKNKNLKESSICRSRVDLTLSLMFHGLWLSCGFGFLL